MVYSIFYYASEAIVRLIVTLAVTLSEKIRELTARGERVVEEEKRREVTPTRGVFYEVTSPLGKEYVWVGRATDLLVNIPGSVGLAVRAIRGKPPVRLYFTFSEAASREWFREIEKLAEYAEKLEREGKGE